MGQESKALKTQVKAVSFWETEVNPFEALAKFLGVAAEEIKETVNGATSDTGNASTAGQSSDKTDNGKHRGGVVVNVNGVFRKHKPKAATPDKRTAKLPDSEEEGETSGEKSA